MNNFKNILKSIIEDVLITDDKLFKQRTIPGIVNTSMADKDSNFNSEKSNDHTTSKYELYLMIQDAIHIYNELENNEFENNELNESIRSIAKKIRNIRTSA